MAESPMETMRDLDEKLLNIVRDTKTLAFEDGDLSKKMKYLIALAMDLSHGATEGVKSIAKQAIKNGASKGEIMETLRVAYFISGVGCVYTAARALKDIF
jgi:alkylhydroperoxidase/carboxymuconolactone decarboxylase family protein YurZ